MKRFRYRALIELDQSTRGDPDKEYLSGTRALMVHAWRIGQPSADRYFSATMSQDDQQPLHAGDHAVVTITVLDDDAPLYLGPGQQFTIWGASTGHGIISRRVFTDSGPC
jgi:hypothetical protein